MPYAVSQRYAHAGEASRRRRAGRELAYMQTFTGRELLVVVRIGCDEDEADTCAPVPETRVAWRAMPEGLDGDDVYASAVPLRTEMRDRFDRFAAQLSGPCHDALMHQMRSARHGETVFLQPGATDYVIPVVFGDRPWEDEHRAAPGDSPFNTWVNGELEALHGVKFESAPPPANKLLWDVRSPNASGPGRPW